MLTKYLHAAMCKASYEILTDGSVYGEIPGFAGVMANTPKLEECREQPLEVLEEWIFLGIHLWHSLPKVDGIELGVGEDIG
ncbi:MAG: type II toxin-antitoxin system HicB family antitoxin [Chloroflexi bacterium]|nr:type II toxin-antitoxin system HicB family antitoxin [Chloroflexota bacterium]